MAPDTFDFIKKIKCDNEIIKGLTAESLRGAMIKHLFYAGASFEEISYACGDDAGAVGREA